MKNIIALLSLTALISACNDTPASKEDQLNSLLQEQAALNDQIRSLRKELNKDDKSAAPLVVIAKTEPVMFKHFVEVQARVDGDQAVQVSPRTQGTITKILVNEGDKVTNGQVLAVLDDQLYQQSLAEVRTQYEYADNIYQKQKALWDQKIGSEVQYLTAKNNKESLEKRLAAVQEQLDMTRIKSPINGTVDNVNLKVGQAVMPGMPAVTVVNLSGLKVKGEVGESYAGKIKKGDEVLLYFPDLNHEVVSKVTYASKVINTLNRTFNVEAAIPQNMNSLSPNMVTVMKIVDYTSSKALVLPIDLIQKSGDGNYVMIAKSEEGNMIATRQKVTTGMTYNGQVEITEGLAADHEVITIGYRDLNEGSVIRLK